MDPITADNRRIDGRAVQRDFPILQRPLANGRRVVYLDSAASAQKPQTVIDRQREVAETFFANAYRGRYDFGDRVGEELENTREAVRLLIGAEAPEEIIFTSGTTMAINLVANAWGRKFLGAGDEVLVTELEHHANIVPWQQIAKERHAVVRWIPVTDDGQLDLSEPDRLFNDRTRIVAVTAMSNVTGTITPLDEIARLAHDAGALVLVDAAQIVPHGPVNVRDFDFLAFSGHKLYGPTGVGVLYGRRSLLEVMDPFLCGGHMIEQVFRDHSTWAQLPAKFEAGTLPIIEAIALRSAIDYVTSLGFDAIAQHEHELTEYAHTQLPEIPGLTLYGPGPDRKGSIVSFTIDGLHPEDLATQLDRHGVFTRHGHHCAMPLHERLGVAATTRASFAVYNIREDVDALVEAIGAARKRFRIA